MNISKKSLNKLIGDNNITTKEYAGLVGLPKLSGGEWSEEKFLTTYDRSLYVFSCISRIAEKMGGIEYKLYRVKNSKGELEQVLVHPLLDLLYNPNPYFNQSKFIKLQQINKLLTGDAYWAKIKAGSKTSELWNLRPDWIKVVPSATDYIKQYVYKIPGQKDIIFEPDEIIHFADPSPIKEFQDRTGQSPLRPAQIRIDTEEYATRFQRDFFKNNARLDAVLQSETPLTADKIENLRHQWNKKYRGVGKNSKIGILEAGLKYIQIATNQKDMDYINGIKATRDDILTIFNVPKPIMSVTDNVNRANSRTAMEVFLRENIKPKMKDLVMTLNQFLTPEFGKDLIIDCVDPSPQDRELILKEYKNASECGWMTQNEIRAKEGLPPLKGGDEPLVDKKLLQQVGLAGNVPFKKTILLNQPIVVNGKEVFEGRSKMFSFIRTKELSEQLSKQYKAKMAKLSEKKKKEINERKKTLWRTYLADRDRRKNILLSEIRAFFKKQEKRIIKSLNTKSFKSKYYFKKYVKKIFDGIDWEEENKKLYAVISPAMEKIAKISGNAAMKRLKIKKPFNINEGMILHWLKNRAEYHSALINTTTKKKLSKQMYEALENGETLSEITKRVKETYKVRNGAEALRIARTETGTVVNKSTLEAYKQTDVVKKKEWIATMDDRVRPEHAEADGQVVDLDKPFLVGGELKDVPDDVNCRCAIGPVIE